MGAVRASERRGETSDRCGHALHLAAELDAIGPRGGCKHNAERRPRSGRAPHLEAVAHEIAERLRHREPQARPAILTRRAAVSLLERVEDRVLTVRRDADPGIDDVDA